MNIATPFKLNFLVTFDVVVASDEISGFPSLKTTVCWWTSPMRSLGNQRMLYGLRCVFMRDEWIHSPYILGVMSKWITEGKSWRWCEISPSWGTWQTRKWKFCTFYLKRKSLTNIRIGFFSRAEYAVYGVTFHRIFRIADPFVLRCSAHILIIKLDRFLLLSILFFTVPLELDSISNTEAAQKNWTECGKKYKSEICRCCCKGFASTHMVCLQWQGKKGQRVESENVRAALSIGFDGCSNKTHSGEESLWSMTIFSLGLLWGEKNLVCVYACYCRSLYRPTRGLIFHHQIIQLKCALLMMCYLCLCIRWCLGNGIAFVARCVWKIWKTCLTFSFHATVSASSPMLTLEIRHYLSKKLKIAHSRRHSEITHSCVYRVASSPLFFGVELGRIVIVVFVFRSTTQQTFSKRRAKRALTKVNSQL